MIADLGIGKPSVAVDISNHDVAAYHSEALSLLGTNDRGPAVTAMGKAFYDPEADEALFSALEARLKVTANRKCERLPFHINAPEFSEALIRVARPYLH